MEKGCHNNSIYIKCAEKANPQRQTVDQFLTRSRERIGEQILVDETSFWGDESLLKLDSVDGRTTLFQ